jgi:hypothetical protein
MRTRQSVLRRAITTVIAALVAALSLIAVAAPAHASSGGGCNSRSARVGPYDTITLGACISYSGGYLRPDYYETGSISNCTVHQGLYINGQLMPDTHNISCSSGHFGPWPYRVLPPSGSAENWVQLVVNGQVVFDLYSPFVYFP